MSNQSERITEEEIIFVTNLRNTTELTWQEITEKFNKKFTNQRGFDGIKKIFYAYSEITEQPNFHINTIKENINIYKLSDLVSL